MTRRIVITGIGLITPIGNGREDFWHACQNGVSGVDRISAFDPEGFPTQIAAEVKDFNPSLYLPPGQMENLESLYQMGLSSAILAVEDSGIDLAQIKPHRIVVSVGSGMGTRLVSEKKLYFNYYGHGDTKETNNDKPYTLGDYVSDTVGHAGPIHNFSNACTTGNHAVGWGFNLLRLGQADVAITGCSEAPILPLTTAGFCAMRAMSKQNENPQRASRPFDRERDGFVLGEGAAFLLLETLEHAKKRSARIYAEIKGYSMTGEAYHMALPDPSASEIAHAMKLALRDSRLPTEKICYINAHGTSTPKNDLGETIAIKKVFGPNAYRIPVSSTKSMIGHTLGAAGAIELAVCALAIRDNIVPPTINYEYKDPDCDLDYVPNESRPWNVKTALSNSFGFGGNNSSIVLERV